MKTKKTKLKAKQRRKRKSAYFSEEASIKKVNKKSSYKKCLVGLMGDDEF